MGSIGPTEVLVVLVIALIVLGPTRLPDAARSVGRAFRELRRVTSGFQDELRSALEAEDPTTASTTPPDTWVSQEDVAPMSTPASSTAPRPNEDDGTGRPEGEQPS